MERSFTEILTLPGEKDHATVAEGRRRLLRVRSSSSPVRRTRQQRFPFGRTHGVHRLEFSHLLPLLKEIGQGLFQKALLVALWSEGYGIPPSKILPLFPFLEKGDERGNLLVQQLSLAAGELQEKEGSLFERMIGEVEREEGLIAEMWKLLAPRTALDIFQQEVIFPSLLRRLSRDCWPLPREEERLPGYRQNRRFFGQRRER